jgi:predicted metal-dependent enzyme (double-stranded beta helix superfamily)
MAREQATLSPIHPALASLARAAKQRDWVSLGGALRGALGAPAWLRPEHRVGDPAHYMRHLLYVDPDGDFVMTAITWLPGQVSPLHGHQVWCLFGVAEGELTEESFSDSLVCTYTARYQAGQMPAPDMDGKAIHRVSNRGTKPLVSLHLYGVAAERLTTGINRLYEARLAR